MTSGYIDPQDQISAIRLGVTPVLTKPFSRKKLLAALHDIFQERRELDKSQSVPGGRLSQLAKKKNYWLSSRAKRGIALLFRGPEL